MPFSLKLKHPSWFMLAQNWMLSLDLKRNHNYILWIVYSKRRNLLAALLALLGLFCCIVIVLSILLGMCLANQSSSSKNQSSSSSGMYFWVSVFVCFFFFSKLAIFLKRIFHIFSYHNFVFGHNIVLDHNIVFDDNLESMLKRSDESSCKLLMLKFYYF